MTPPPSPQPPSPQPPAAPDPAAPYRKDADGSRWGDPLAAGWYWRQAGQGRLELMGDCLRCGHELGAVVNTFVVAATSPGQPSPVPADPVPVNVNIPANTVNPVPGELLPSTVVCECGERHRGRPADAAFQGCGAVFRGLEALEVRP